MGGGGQQWWAAAMDDTMGACEREACVRAVRAWGESVGRERGASESAAALVSALSPRRCYRWSRECECECECECEYECECECECECE